MVKPPSGAGGEKNDQRISQLREDITRLTAELAGLAELPRNAARAATVAELEKKIATARKSLVMALSSTVRV